MRKEIRDELSRHDKELDDLRHDLCELYRKQAVLNPNDEDARIIASKIALKRQDIRLVEETIERLELLAIRQKMGVPQYD